MWGSWKQTLAKTYFTEDVSFMFKCISLPFFLAMLPQAGWNPHNWKWKILQFECVFRPLHYIVQCYQFVAVSWLYHISVFTNYHTVTKNNCTSNNDKPTESCNGIFYEVWHAAFIWHKNKPAPKTCLHPYKHDWYQDTGIITISMVKQFTRENCWVYNTLKLVIWTACY